MSTGPSPATPVCSPRVKPPPQKAAARGQVDFAARRKLARENMEPHLAEAGRAKTEVVYLKEKLRALRTIDSAEKTIEARRSGNRRKQLRNPKLQPLPSMRQSST